MSNEIFAWTAASNNQAFLAGRLSMTMNAISIARSAENSGNLARRRPVACPIPEVPHGASGSST